jgi:uncharacterized membrane protein
MEQFIWFLGRFHVLALHLPIGIMMLAIAFECLVRWRPFSFLKPAISWTWFAGGVTGVATVILGLMHATESSFEDNPAVDAHRLAGISLTALAFLIWILRLRLQPAAPAAWPAWARTLKADTVYAKLQPLWAPGGRLDRLYDTSGWIVASALAFIMMSITGHLGGNLTHGDTYLVQYAPGPIRVMAGLPANAGPRPKPKDLASADIYLDIVQPALEQRCANCHNNSKTSGGLSVATYESLMKGGEKGPVIVPGKPAASDLFHRVTLAPDSKDFMPKDGKTPLNKNEIAAIGWWIQQGAPKTATVGSLKLTADATNAIRSIIGAPDGAEPQETAAAGPGEAPLPTAPEADKAAVAKLMGEGFIVRRISKGSNLVDVDYTSPKPVTPEIMADLAKIAPNIMRLNLRRAGVGDAEVKTIATFKNLRHLRLEKNDITDAAARDLSALKDLTHLNLTNTKIGDEGFGAVAKLPKLQRLYFWGAAVTPAAVERLRAQRKDVMLYAGLSPKDIPAEGKVIPPDF